MGETTRPRGICPVCRKQFTITKAGVMRWHAGDRPTTLPFRKMCEGAGQPPEGTVKS